MVQVLRGKARVDGDVRVGQKAEEEAHAPDKIVADKCYEDDHEDEDDYGCDHDRDHDHDVQDRGRGRDLEEAGVEVEVVRQIGGCEGDRLILMKRPRV
jgi:hypothetical protein